MSAHNKAYRGAVVFLDRLGTKGIWKTRDPEAVIVEYQEFINNYKTLVSQLNDAQAEFKILGFDAEYKLSAFSDTILVTSEIPKASKSKMTNGDLVSLSCSSIAPMMLYAAAKGIYLRGAMSVGEFYRLEDALIGPTIDEAAQYYSLPDWVGVSAAPSVHHLLSNHSGSGPDPRSLFVRWDIPWKNGGFEKNGWALNWGDINTYLRYVEEDDRDAWEKAFKVVKEKAYKEIQTIDIDIAMKWRHTIEFIEKNSK